MAGAVRLVVQLVDGDVSKLHVRDKTVANKFLSAVSKAEFWDLTQALGKVAKPLTSLSGWIRGCTCHERDRESGKHVICKWAGCRAFELAPRITAAAEEFNGLRD
jgi:hypothetical protein